MFLLLRQLLKKLLAVSRSLVADHTVEMPQELDATSLGTLAKARPQIHPTKFPNFFLCSQRRQLGPQSAQQSKW